MRDRRTALWQHARTRWPRVAIEASAGQRRGLSASAGSATRVVAHTQEEGDGGGGACARVGKPELELTESESAPNLLTESESAPNLLTESESAPNLLTESGVEEEGEEEEEEEEEELLIDRLCSCLEDYQAENRTLRCISSVLALSN